MPALSPLKRISTRPARNENTAPRPTARISDSLLDICVVARNLKRVGMDVWRVAVGLVRSPAANAPTATKLICPNDHTPEFPMNTYNATTMVAVTRMLIASACRDIDMALPATATTMTRARGPANSATGRSFDLTPSPRSSPWE